MKRSLLIGIAFTFINISAYCQQVLMQGWYWDYPKTIDGYSWADTLRLKAAQLKQDGITHIWFPPHAVASSGTGSNGYDPKDLFIGNQTTGLGTRPNLNAMLTEFTSQGIAPVADMIYNHRDGGKAENNSAVKDYITIYYNDSKEPYPSDRFRVILPIGGSTGNGAGDYYFKLSSKSNGARFNGYKYKLYMQTNTVGYSGLPAQTESEPNGGGDCSQPNNDITLGRDMNVTVETGGGCGTDEFHLNLKASDFNASGDTIFIYMTNTGGYSDHRIYGLWSGPRSMNIVNELSYQTYTDFNSVPSGRGKMNFEFFKPNSNNASTTYLSGDWDGMYFYYDYDQFQPQTKDSLIAYSEWNYSSLGVRGFRMDAVKHFTPEFVGDMLDKLHDDSMDPSLVVGEWYSTNTSELKGWVNDVESYMNAGTKAAIKPKIFDFALRENLRQACDVGGYDVRNVFNGSLHDAEGLSGYNIVTFVNNHDFRDMSGFASLVRNHPNLAYAYILTNNQLGVPTIFYPDYFGYPAPSGGKYSYHPTNLPAYRPELLRLMKALKQYINGSPSVDYLNRFSTPYASNYTGGSASQALIYQLEGHAGNGNKEMLVAINFGSTTLKVDHEINTRGGIIVPGTKFVDVLGLSNYPYQLVDNSNEVYFELPPYSYSVWVQDGTVLPVNIVSFTASAARKSTLLEWKVTDNDQIAEFEVQRSVDGKTFQSLASVNASVKQGNEDYFYTDEKPMFNTAIYYRLKMLGKDGSALFSKIQLVKILSNDLEISLLGNPATNELKMQINSEENSICNFVILGQNGDKLLEKEAQVSAGNSMQTINIKELTAGIYFLRVTNGSGYNKVINFVKSGN
jgi:alpha-amylase